MGRLDFDVPENLFEGIENFEEIATSLLNEAAPILEKTLKEEIIRTGHSDSGDLANSIKYRKAKLAKTGAYISVTRPEEYSEVKGKKRKKREKIANVRKLIGLEYGTSKQNPTPVIQKAINRCEKECQEKMQQEFEKRVKG